MGDHNLKKPGTGISPKNENETISNNKNVWDMATTSTVGLVASPILTKPPQPDLRRQPKVKEFTAKLAKEAEDEKAAKKKERNEELKNLRREAFKEKQEKIKSRMSVKSSKAFEVNEIERELNEDGEELRKESNETILDEDEENYEDDRWSELKEELQTQEYPSEERHLLYEMANVNLDVNQAQIKMDQVLVDIEKEGRLTERQKLILKDKHDLLLQALVSFQEREIELIDNLRTKDNILVALKNFVQEEVVLTKNLITVDQSQREIFPVVEKNTENKQKRVRIMNTASIEDTGEPGAGEQQKFENLGLSLEEMSASALRENLLNQKNMLEMQEHMKGIHVLELKTLEFEKLLLSMHYSRMIKPTDLNKEIKEMKRSINDLNLEVASTIQEIGHFQGEIAAQEQAYAEDELSLDKSDLELLTKQMEVQANLNKPFNLSKEAERTYHNLQILQDDYDYMCSDHMEKLDGLRKFQIIVDRVNIEIQVLLREEQRIGQGRRISQEATDTILNQMESLLTREQTLLDKSAQAVEKLSSLKKHKKSIVDELRFVTNEASRAQREFLKIDRSIKVVAESHLNVRLAYDKMKSAFEYSHPRGEAENWEKSVEKFSKEINRLKMDLEKRIDEATSVTNTAKRIQKSLNKLYDRQLEHGLELQDLIRLTVKKRREREEKSAHCIKLEAQLLRVAQDKKMQQLTIDDCVRNEREIGNSMGLVRKKYGEAKIDRSNLMNKLVEARQKISEEEEKLKIGNNEIDALNNQCLEKEKKIHQSHFMALNANLRRNSERNETLRNRDSYRRLVAEKQRIQAENRSHRELISKQEDDMKLARERFERGINSANKLALEVRERIEEICILAQKRSILEMIKQKGLHELNIKELEKTELESYVAEVKSHLYILTYNAPNTEKYYEKIELLRVEFYKKSEERIDLEEKFTDFKADKRIRELNFKLLDKKENLSSLEVKMKHLEEELASKTALILEKDLIRKQIDYITETGMKRATEFKLKYDNDVKSIVSNKKIISEISTRINGLISETAIAKANAEAAEKIFKKIKTDFEEAECRFSQGLDPTTEMTQEWEYLKKREKLLNKFEENRGKRFFRGEVKTLKGAEIFMNRYRPNPNKRLDCLKVDNVAISSFERPQIRFPCGPSKILGKK